MIAGLNILSFMARCDGQWHPLETEAIERFVTSLWIRKEWDGDPPLDDIIAHAQRLSPDANTALQGLLCFASNPISTKVLMRSISDLISSDGIICDEEHRWSVEIAEFIAEIQSRPRPSEMNGSHGWRMLTGEDDRTGPIAPELTKEQRQLLSRKSSDSDAV